MVEVYQPGTNIVFKGSKIEGLINCVCIYAHGGILYEIAYWQGGDRKTCWVNPVELVESEYFKERVGFKTGG